MSQERRSQAIDVNRVSCNVRPALSRNGQYVNSRHERFELKRLPYWRWRQPATLMWDHRVAVGVTLLFRVLLEAALLLYPSLLLVSLPAFANMWSRTSTRAQCRKWFNSDGALVLPYNPCRCGYGTNLTHSCGPLGPLGVLAHELPDVPSIAWPSMGSCEEYRDSADPNKTTALTISPLDGDTDYPFVLSPRAGYCRTTPGMSLSGTLASTGTTLLLVAFLWRLRWLMREQSRQHDKQFWTPSDFTVLISGLPIHIEGHPTKTDGSAVTVQSDDRAAGAPDAAVVASAAVDAPSACPDAAVVASAARECTQPHAQPRIFARARGSYPRGELERRVRGDLYHLGYAAGDLAKVEITYDCGRELELLNKQRALQIQRKEAAARRGVVQTDGTPAPSVAPSAAGGQEEEVLGKDTERETADANTFQHGTDASLDKRVAEIAAQLAALESEPHATTGHAFVTFRHQAMRNRLLHVQTLHRSVRRWHFVRSLPSTLSASVRRSFVRQTSSSGGAGAVSATSTVSARQVELAVIPSAVPPATTTPPPSPPADHATALAVSPTTVPAPPTTPSSTKPGASGTQPGVSSRTGVFAKVRATFGLVHGHVGVLRRLEQSAQETLSRMQSTALLARAKISIAPDPSTVHYANLEVARLERTKRRTLFWSLSMILILLNGVGQVLLKSWLKSQVFDEHTSEWADTVKGYFSLVMAMVTMTVNVLLRITHRALMGQEKLTSREAEQISMFKKLTAWYEKDGMVEMVFALIYGDAGGTIMRVIQIPPIFKRCVLTRLTKSQEKTNELWRPEPIFVGELYANMLKTISICLVYSSIWPLAYALTPFALLMQYLCFNFALVFWWGAAPQLTDELMHYVGQAMGVVLAARWVVEVAGLTKARDEKRMLPLALDITRVLINAAILFLGYYYDACGLERRFPGLRRYRYEETDEDAVAYEDVEKHRGAPLETYECPTLGGGRTAAALQRSFAKTAHGHAMGQAYGLELELVPKAKLPPDALTEADEFSVRVVSKVEVVTCPPMGPTTFSWYFNMILAVYAALGVFMFKAGNDVRAHKMVVGIVIWTSIAHFAVLVPQVFLDDTPSWSGEFMGIEIPARIYGIAHWQNISPVGDVWLVMAFALGDMFLAYKAFGTLLSPFAF